MIPVRIMRYQPIYVVSVSLKSRFLIVTIADFLAFGLLVQINSILGVSKIL